MFDSKKARLSAILAPAGVTLNGTNPWDIQIHNPQAYARILDDPSLGLGESYMAGWWDCQQLDSFFTKVLARIDIKVAYKKTTIFKFLVKHVLTNLQSVASSKK